MREITDHKIYGQLNESVRVTAIDETGSGGANHAYDIDLMNGDELRSVTAIRFQKDPIKEAGANGITNEALLAVVIDRLRSFQAGPFKCRENAIAFTKLEEALMWLQRRTYERMARGVEGTHQL